MIGILLLVGAFWGPPTGWGEEKEKDPLPELIFTDITAEAGIDFVHVHGAYGEKLLPEMMGGGVAFFD